MVPNPLPFAFMLLNFRLTTFPAYPMGQIIAKVATIDFLSCDMGKGRMTYNKRVIGFTQQVKMDPFYCLTEQWL